MKGNRFIKIVNMIMLLAIIFSSSVFAGDIYEYQSNLSKKVEQVSLNSLYKGTMKENSSKTFSFTLPRDGNVTFEISFNGIHKQGFSASLYGQNMNYIKNINTLEGKETYALKEGKYYIGLHTEEIVSYKVKLTLEKIGAPANFAFNSSTNSSVTLSWDKVDGTEGYRVYYSSNAYNEKSIECGSETIIFTINGLNPSTCYQFRIEALFKGGYCSESSEIIEAYTTSTVKLKAVRRYKFAKSDYRNASKENKKLFKNKSKNFYYVEYEHIYDEYYYYGLKEIRLRYSVNETMKNAKTILYSPYKIKYGIYVEVGSPIKFITNKKLARKLGNEYDEYHNSKYLSLKPRKKYYFQIRSEYTSKGRKYCSDWSNIKSIKTK